jgi:hypothetical protein
MITIENNRRIILEVENADSYLEHLRDSLYGVLQSMSLNGVHDNQGNAHAVLEFLQATEKVENVVGAKGESQSTESQSQSLPLTE